jgi:thiopeptide-type bacteriocin biosynthesis protein
MTGEATMGSPGWISAHIYRCDSLDALIDGAARPLVAELRAGALIDGHFFVRYWQGGPHLRLRLRPSADAHRAVVNDALDAAIGAFLRAHPSRNAIRPEDYLASARPLSLAEPGGHAIEPLEPVDTVRRRSYEPEHDRYGGAAAMAAAEQQFIASSDIAYDVIAAHRGRDHRTGHALAAMFVAAAVCEGPEGIVAYCSAARSEWGRGLMFGDVDRQEAQLDERYRRQRPRLRELVQQLTELVTGGASDDGALGQWLSAMRNLKASLVALDAAGQLAHSIGRVIRLCTHMHCNRLGISLPEEAYLRYLLWRAAGDLASGEPAAPEPAHHDERQP